jgi:hypothetical protein
MNPINQDWLEKRLYEDRVYEGEWLFVCRLPCPGYIIEYAFTGWNDDLIDAILSSRTGGHGLENCHLCGGLLEWAGYPLQLPITHSLLALVNDYHFMASTLVLTAIVDNTISNLLWAAFVDSGLGAKKAKELAKAKVTRSEALQAIRSITAWPINDIIFPTRNLVAHGRGFGNDEHFYKSELVKQIAGIREWIDTICQEVTPTGFMPKETDRWLLFMSHWSFWLTSIADYIHQMSRIDLTASSFPLTTIKVLINGKHFMVSTIILAAIVEDTLKDLLYSLLSDKGMDEGQASQLVCGNLGRSATLQMIRLISTCTIKDIVFPVRNLVAHGKGFAKGDAFYKLELVKQVNSICTWLQQTSAELRTKGFITGKCDLWLSSMDNLRSQLTSLVPELSSTG